MPEAIRGICAACRTLDRFQREAEAVAKLRHPNIISIYQVGEAEGVAYYIMPLIEGESLRARLDREGRLPIEEARRLIVEVASALSVAHRAGIVHRDIKPDNILLEGEERRAVVTDFGIAKAVGGGETGLTGTGMIVGTPHYMSPEQALSCTYFPTSASSSRTRIPAILRPRDGWRCSSPLLSTCGSIRPSRTKGCPRNGRR